jgi:hypothetical protein
MKRYVITVGTVTYALKGRDILRKAGKKAWVEKIISNGKSNGCSFAIITEGDLKSAEQILIKNGIRILEIN